MFLKAQPIGVNPPNDEDRIALWKVINGDEWTLTTQVMAPPGMTQPAVPDNSKLVFVLSEDRFHNTALWTGYWLDGILPVDPFNHPGLVVIRIPDAITTTLRRGAYSFSLTVADIFGRHVTTVLTGTLQVEYEPTSPEHNIPYRSDS